MKISEMTIEMLAEYLRLDYSSLTEAEQTELTVMYNAACSFIYGYTGLTAEEADSHDDFAVVVYVLVQDMYDNRNLYVDKSNCNKTVESILAMHAGNLL